MVVRGRGTMERSAGVARLAVFMALLGLVTSGCAQPAEPWAQSTATAAPAVPGKAAVPGKTAPRDLPPGSKYLNPASGRIEIIDPLINETAVLVGDSQAAGAAGVAGPDTWPQSALRKAGYRVSFSGGRGTGYVAASRTTGNYVDALERGDWYLPYGDPPLVVLEGGGNDASRGATDERIVANAGRLLAAMRKSYPRARFLMVGTLARGSNNDGGRRSQVDALLGTFARRWNVPFISLGDWLTRYELTGMMADRVHLTAEGHRRMAERFLAELTRMHLTAEDPGAPPVAAGSGGH